MDATTTMACALCGTGTSTGKRAVAAPGKLLGAETCLSCETLLDKLSTGHITGREFDVLAGHAQKLNDSELGRQLGNMRHLPDEAPVPDAGKPWALRPDQAPAASTPAVPATSEPTTKVASTAAIVISSIWMIGSLLIGMTFINTEFEAYGGDAFTGIQNAVVVATRALGWIIIGTGVLGLVTAMERKVTRA